MFALFCFVLMKFLKASFMFLSLSGSKMHMRAFFPQRSDEERVPSILWD